MKRSRKQNYSQRPTDGEDFRTRYDGIERIGEQQFEALRRLDRESTTTTSGVVRDGHLAALQGRFLTGSHVPIEAAIAFLRKHAAAFGFDIHGNDAFAAPRMVSCHEGLPDDVSTVVFDYRLRGIPTYRAGATVGVDRGGSVRFVRALVPAGTRPAEYARRLDKPKGGAAAARGVAAALLGDGELPEPTYELFDPALVLGETGRPAGVWVFDIRGDTPVHVLVEDASDKVFRVVTNPGCPIGALPTYHLNRVTLAPDMVLFPGGGLLLSEASTRNPIAVARALFERFPKLFGTGDPASQLALVDVLAGPDPQIPTTTVVFHQRWGALPVFGCQLRVHLSKALAVRSVSGNFLRDPNVSTTPTVSESAARMAASTTAVFELVRLDDTYRPTRGFATAVAGIHAAMSSEPANPQEVQLSYDEPMAHGPGSSGGPTRTEELDRTSGRPERTDRDHMLPSTDRDARAAALRRAAEFHRASMLEPERAVTTGVPNTEDRGLVILPTSLMRSGQGENHLAWWFRHSDADRFISATTGALVLTVSRILTAERVYDAENATDPQAEVNPQFIDGNPQVPAANLDPEAQAAAAAVAEVAAIWRGTFKRDSWDGRGANMDAYVDWQNDPKTRARWEGHNKRTVYSRNGATDDIVGHEFTHALTEKTAGLVYLDESGAANEHYSDLFGNLIFPNADPRQWDISGGNIKFGGIFENPLDKTLTIVDTYQKYVVLQPTDDNGGVHTNSGILNRAAVLLCDDAPQTQTSTQQKGIGRSRLARLAWDTLVFRLHPLASFSDIMNLTWARSRELAEDRALPYAGVPDTRPLLPFDQKVTDAVVWAFQQVGLVFDVQTGWYDVTANTPFEITPGNPGFLAVETLYQGLSLTDGRTLTDMQVRLFQRRLNQPDTGVTSGSMSVNTGGVFNDPNGAFSASITAPTAPIPAGTTSLETTVRITSPTAVRVFLDPVPVIAYPPGPPPPPPALSVTPMDSPLVGHWDDWGIGWRYQDVVYLGAQLPVGCFVTNVELQVRGMANIRSPGGDSTYLIASTTAVGVTVGDANRGAHIMSRTLGGRSLQVKVHSWHNAWSEVLYRLRYSVAGNACSLPPFTLLQTYKGP